MWLRWWEVLLNPLGNDSVVTEDWQLLKFSLWWNLGSIKAWSKKWQKWEKEKKKKKNIKISIGQSHHSYLEFYMRSHQNWVQGVMLESCHFKDQVISEIRYSAFFFFFPASLTDLSTHHTKLNLVKLFQEMGHCLGSLITEKSLLWWDLNTVL